MSETAELKAVLSAEDNASPIVRKLINDLKQLEEIAKRAGAAIGMGGAEAQERANAAVRRGLGLQAQASRQRTDAAQQERGDSIAFESEAVRNLRTRMRLNRQQARESMAADRAREDAAADHQRQIDRASRALEAAAVRRQRADAADARRRAAADRAAERDRSRAEAQAERDQAAAARRRISLDNYRFGLRARYERQEAREREREHREARDAVGHAFRQGRSTAGTLARPGAAATVLGIAGATEATRRALRVETDVDSAEIDSRIYGDLSKDQARTLRDQWAAPLAESLGVSSAKLITSYTDALKAGIPEAGAKPFAELATKTSEAWKVPFESVVDILGIVKALQTSDGTPFSFDKLQGTANAIQYLSQKQATTPERLISFLKRGAGGAQLLGMSQEAGLAFGSASTSLGNQAGSSGSLLDYVAGRVSELPRLVRKKGDEGNRAREMVRALGYGSPEALDRARRANPDDFLPDFVERFGKISDPKKRDQALHFFTGREWFGEFGRMVKGIETYKEAARLAKESRNLDTISEAWKLHREKLGFVYKQFRAGWQNVLGEAGKVISPLARQFGDYWLEWTAKLRAGGFQARVRASVEGLIEGLGFRDLPDMLNRVLGKPGEGSAGAIESWRAAARGFGQGIRDVADATKSVLGVFTGRDADPETIGRVAAQLGALSIAAIGLGPALGALASITALITALGAAVSAVATLGAAGVAGTAGAGVAGGLAAVLGAAVLPVSLVAISAGVVAALFGRQALKGLFLGVPSGDGGKPDTPEGKLGAELGAIAPRKAPAIDPPARVQKQSAAEDWRGLIQPAALRVLADVVGEHAASNTETARDMIVHTDAIERLNRTIQGVGVRFQLASLSTSMSHGFGSAVSGGAGGSLVSSSGVPGVPGDPAKQFGRNFFTPPGMSVPGWHGKASGLPDPGAGSGPYKAALDYIAQAEGTAGAPGGGYGTSLGYGKFLPGGHEQNLTEMSLRQILALGDYMRRQPGNPNSSALGRYQIVGQTLRDLMRKLGLSGDEKFDAALQDRLGAELIRQRGANAHGLGQEWASLKGGKGLRAAELVGQIPQGAPTAPEPRGPVVGGVHPLDGAGRLTSAFGMRRHPLSGQYKMHNGIDLAAPAGTVVKAMKAGIASIDRSGDVTVKHDDGTSTTYRHVQAAVEAGARVAEGQAIARLRANDPRSTGPHLHLEARDREGRVFDPRSLLVPSDRLVEAAKDVDGGFTSTGWRKAAEGAPAAGAGLASTGWRKAAGGLPSLLGAAGSGRAEEMVRDVPLPPRRPAGMGGGSSGGSTGPVQIIVNGGGASPDEIAQKVQSRFAEHVNYSNHDFDPEVA